MDSIMVNSQVTSARWKYLKIGYIYGPAPKAMIAVNSYLWAEWCYLATKCAHLFLVLLEDECQLSSNEVNIHDLHVL